MNKPTTLRLINKRKKELQILIKQTELTMLSISVLSTKYSDLLSKRNLYETKLALLKKQVEFVNSSKCRLGDVIENKLPMEYRLNL